MHGIERIIASNGVHPKKYNSMDNRSMRIAVGSTDLFDNNAIMSVESPRATIPVDITLNANCISFKPGICLHDIPDGFVHVGSDVGIGVGSGVIITGAGAGSNLPPVVVGTGVGMFGAGSGAGVYLSNGAY